MDRAGRIIDKYELLEKVGEGGMAEVYRGRHRTLGREVAIKLLHPHLSATERNRLRFEREARAIESLEHDHILRIFDYSGKDSEISYIVTEFIEGQTLKGILEEVGRLPSEVAAMVGLELCDALAYAHARGIIHRDIKPENVMIRRDGLVKLMDFGIARVLDESSMTLTGGLVGSPAYMSPEQACDQEIDERSDIFSLGTLLYRAVTGHLPFVGSSAPVILRAILDGEFPDPQDVEPGVDPAMSDLIRRALSPDRAKRQQDANELAAELSRLLEDNRMSRGALEIKRYLGDPIGYEEWLKSHLSTTLAERGQALIQQGSRLTAMKLFNRVLYLDEHNEAVLAIIQQLHREERPIRKAILMVAGGMLGLAGAIWGGMQLWEKMDFTWKWPWSDPIGVVDAGSRGAIPSALGMEELQALLSPDGELVPTPTAEPVPLPTPVGASRLGEGNLLPGPNPGAERVDLARGSFKPAKGTSRLTPPKGREREAEGGRSTQARDGLPVVVNIRTNHHADIYIDGHFKGNSRLLREPITLLPGAYQVRLMNEYCRPLEERIVVPAGAPFDRYFELKPLPAQLRLANFPNGTELFLDGDRLGTWPGVQQTTIRSLESHTVKARLPDGSERVLSVPAVQPTKEYVLDGGAS